MSAPNIVGVSTISGKVAVQIVSDAPTAIVANVSGSNKVLKVNTLMIGNVNGSNNIALTVELCRASVPYRFGPTIAVPANGGMDVLNRPLYLEEGDSLRLTGSTASMLEAICSYEEIA